MQFQIPNNYSKTDSDPEILSFLTMEDSREFDVLGATAISNDFMFFSVRVTDYGYDNW